MLNRVSIVGRITRDLELRSSVNNVPYVAFTVAVNNYFGGKEVTSFIPCFAWNKVAENMVKFLAKGSLVAVDGRIQSRSDNSNPNQPTLIINVNAENVSFLDRKGSYDNNSTSQNNNAVNEPQPSFNQPVAELEKEEIVETSFEGDDAILWD